MLELIWNENKFFNNVNTLICFEDENEGSVFFDKLFENASKFDILPRNSKNNTLTFVLDGGVRKFNYARFRNKLYTVAKANTIFENELEKSEYLLELDDINTELLTIPKLTENMTEENFFLYRTNMVNIENTQDNLLRCSKVCEKIDSDRVNVKENILPIALRESETASGLDENEENCVLIFYIKLVGKLTTVKTAINIFSGINQSDTSSILLQLYLANGFTSSDFEKVDNALNQKALIVNGEIVPYVALIVPTIRNFKEYVKTNGQDIQNPFTDLEGVFNRISAWANIQTELGEIKFDFLPRRTFNKWKEQKTILPVLTAGNVNFLYQNVAGFIFAAPSGVTGGNSQSSIPNFPLLKTWKNELNKDHLTYAHKQPTLYSQRWTETEKIDMSVSEYRLCNVVLPSACYIEVFKKNETYEETYTGRNKNLNTTADVPVSVYLDPQSAKLNQTNEAVSNGIIQALTIGIASMAAFGAPAIASMGVFLGVSAAGGTIGSVVRGTAIYSKSAKPTLHGGFNTTGNEKKNINYFPENGDAFRRLSVYMFEYSLTKKEIEIIEKDRQNKGDYYNKWATITRKNIKTKVYIEGEFVSFRKNIKNVNTENRIKKLIEKGVWINIMANFKTLGGRTVVGSSVNATLKLSKFEKSIGNGLDRYEQNYSTNSATSIGQNNDKATISLRYATVLDNEGNLGEIDNELLLDVTLSNIYTDDTYDTIAIYTGRKNEYQGIPEVSISVNRKEIEIAPGLFSKTINFKIEGTKNSSDSKVLVYAAMYK